MPVWKCSSAFPRSQSRNDGETSTNTAWGKLPTNNTREWIGSAASDTHWQTHISTANVHFADRGLSSYKQTVENRDHGGLVSMQSKAWGPHHLANSRDSWFLPAPGIVMSAEGPDNRTGERGSKEQSDVIPLIRLCLTCLFSKYACSNRCDGCRWSCYASFTFCIIHLLTRPHCLNTHTLLPLLLRSITWNIPALNIMSGLLSGHVGLKDLQGTNSPVQEFQCHGGYTVFCFAIYIFCK